MADIRIRTKPSRSDGRGRAPLWPLIAICTAYFMIILDTTVVSVALLGTLVADHARFVPGLRIGMAIAGCAFAAGAVLTAAKRGLLEFACLLGI
jgi:hypothetical protein